MNKAELIDVLTDKLGTDRRQATAAVENVVDTIVRAVHKGDSVTITGFGVFEQRRRAARVARNPRTGETVKVKPTSVPAFRPGAQFKAVVSGSQKLPADGPAVKRGATAAPARKTAVKKAAA
ncbi:MAG: HU family DNA-binding protein, partial [Mycolicibacterium sp.]|nr:HU family DNA-binding protein [Mycolicibacterium sp.]